MGASASARLDIPAYASLDWVHQFNDRLSLGASATWTEWSSFQDLTLKSHGNTIVSIPTPTGTPGPWRWAATTR